MPKVLYGVERSPTVRAVLVTARALGVNLEVEPVEPTKGEQKEESFLKMNPAHTIPTLDDDGFYVWESRVILGYLVSKYGKDDKLYPKNIQQRATVDTILHFDNGSVWSSIFKYFLPVFVKGEPPNPENEEAIKDKLTTLERILSNQPYLAGDHLTIADISVVTSVSFIQDIGFPLEEFPKIKSLIAKVKTDLPFFEEVNKNGHDDLIAFLPLYKMKPTL